MMPLKIFISYTQSDRQWAEWIAWEAEEVGHEVKIQAWDFGVGKNFLHEMDEAAKWSDVTVMVLSDEYLASKFCKVEWYAAYVQDPVGEDQKLVPVRVQPCTPAGLLASVVYVDLVGEAEDVAREKVLAALDRERGKPSAPIAFPGKSSKPRAPFPRAAVNSQASEPSPDYPNPETQALAEELERARETMHEQAGRDEDTAQIREQILNLRRKLREGGLKAGDTLSDGRYKLIRELGKGGFAHVWRAYDRKRTRHVAVKVLHLQYSNDSSRLERFRRGARQMADLQHDHIVQVYDYDLEDGGYHFFVMECLNCDFRQAVLKGRLDSEERLAVIVKIGQAVQAAHDRGVIHRDIKPANILVDENGSPKLTDFDLVRVADSTGGTRTGAMGSFVYAAPELLHRPQDAAPAVDVYGLGMTAVFALCGHDLPFEVFRDSAGFLETRNDSAKVREALLRAVEWEQDKRWPSVREFSEALSQAIAASLDEAPERMRVPESKPEVWRPDHEGGHGIPSESRTQIDYRKLLRRDGDLEQQAQNVIKAGEMWEKTVSWPGEIDGGEDIFPVLVARLLEVMQTAELSAVDRHKAGILASDLGHLPDDLDTFVVLPEEWFGYPLQIGRYPVTNAQYRRFMEDGGYDRETGWLSEEARKEMQRRLGRGNAKDPRHWNNPSHNRTTRPVVGVSWYEAEAYCKWLTAKMRAAGEIGEDEEVRLPTFEERKKVAEGATKRKFPWGDKGEVHRLNCKESEIGSASPVHMYPDGATPEGVWDLSGNVWEWTSTKEETDYPAYVLGGGYRNQNISLNTSAARFWFDAGLVWGGYGFRVSVSPLLL